MKCKECGAEMPQGAVFCGVCGALVTADPEPEFNPVPDNEITCRSCGAKLKPDAVYCDRCGASVIEKDITCIKCGAKIVPGTLYCGVCGEPTGSGGSGREIPKPPPKSKMPLIICICVSVIALIAIFSAVSYITSLRQAILYESISSGTGTSDSQNQTSDIATLAPAAPTPAPTPRPTVNYTGDYLFPSDSVYIQESDLAGKSQSDVRLILNEIYARRGYIFSTDYYRQYFSAKSWYTPVTSSQEECERRFNAIEKANKDFLSKYEQARGWR